MDFLSAVTVFASIVVVLFAVDGVRAFRALKKDRVAIEESLRLREIVKRQLSRLYALENRDEIYRRVLIRPVDLGRPESVREIYERLLEKDLKVESSEVRASVMRDPAQTELMKVYVKTIVTHREASHWIAWIATSGLIRAAVASRLSAVDEVESKRGSILDLMLGRRMKIYSKAYAVLFAALGFALILGPVAGLALATAFVPIFFLAVLAANQKLLEVRVAKGLFGNNAAEAAEFLSFIKTHADKGDFSDGDKMRRLFPEGQVITPRRVKLWGGEAQA